MRRDDVVQLAEQATLGALLLEPARLGEVQKWLRAGDFADLWHAQLFTTLLEHHAAHDPIAPQTVARALVDRVGSRQANMPRFADLLHVTPPHPDAIGYARLVLDSGLRHEIAGQGVLLRAAALQSALDGVPQPILSTCNLVDAGLDVAAARWAAGHGLPHDTVVVPLALRPALRNTEARMGADKYLTAHPARDLLTERRHTVELIGALIASPDHVAVVATWLTPARIHDPAWRAIYATLVELADLGQHVDLVTVAWEARKHAQHGPALPGLNELRAAVDDGWHTQVHSAERSVAGDQIRHLADTGADQLLAGAANPGVLVTDLVDTGHLIADALRRTATGLSRPVDTAAPQRQLTAVHTHQQVAR
ncbi:hypothetical protein HP550_01035 [Cellulomonas humilata]|uniref:DNA helicase DnaB-like N-terminal domain-containing protein n=1 Tax=Cellulomonas humilata TaxID=144055 RepID=A0A7Y6DWE7_9CELL|nr:DnaB-like helicase N-terminal domain-containing protein [Cellulomonas humilata]NUU15834.1 hypothetical protein [Cellulomonas humilata]